MLDNFEHIQSSWFSEDREAGLLGLLAGANDYGGLLFEENVLDQAGHAPKISEREVRDSIREMGFVPAQRDSFYNLVVGHLENDDRASLLPEGEGEECRASVTSTPSAVELQ